MCNSTSALFAPDLEFVEKEIWCSSIRRTASGLQNRVATRAVNSFRSHRKRKLKTYPRPQPPLDLAPHSWPDTRPCPRLAKSNRHSLHGLERWQSRSRESADQG